MLPKRAGSPSGCCHPGNSRAAQKLQLAAPRSPCLAQLQSKTATEQAQTSIGVADGAFPGSEILLKAGVSQLLLGAHDLRSGLMRRMQGLCKGIDSRAHNIGPNSEI